MRKEQTHISELNDILRTFRDGIESSSLLEQEPNITVDGLKAQLEKKNQQIEHLTQTVKKLQGNTVTLDVYNQLKLESSKAICENELAKTELQALRENYTHLERLTETLRSNRGGYDKSEYENDIVLKKETKSLQDEIKSLHLKIDSLENSKKHMKSSYDTTIDQLVHDRDQLAEQVDVLTSMNENYKNRISVEDRKGSALRDAYQRIKEEFENYTKSNSKAQIMEENQMLKKQIEELKGIYNKHLDCVDSRKRELESRIHKLEMERIDSTVSEKTYSYNENLIQNIFKLFKKHFAECPDNPSLSFIESKLTELVNVKQIPPDKNEIKIRQLESLLSTTTSKLHNLQKIGDTKDCTECRELNSKTVQLNSMAAELQHYKEIANENSQYQGKYQQSQVLISSLREELDALKYKYNSMERQQKALSAVTNKTESCGSVTHVIKMNDERNVELDAALRKADQIRGFFLSEVKIIRQVVGCFLGWDFMIERQSEDSISVIFKCLYSGPTSSSMIKFSSITVSWMQAILSGSHNIDDSLIPIMELEGDYLDRIDHNKLLSEQSASDWYAQFMAMLCLEDFTARIM